MADIEMENSATESISPKVELKSEEQHDQQQGSNGDVPESNNVGDAGDAGVVKDEVMDADASKNQGNGVPEQKYQDNPNYHMYLSKKMQPKVAEKLIDLCENLGLSSDDFDERAVEMLASFSPEHANFILEQLLDSQMYGVQNKPQYLMSVMRNFKDRVRSLGSQQAANIPLIPGPKVESIKAIIDRTGYQLEVTVGQRKYHNPPDSDGVDHGANSASSGACIYIGQIPRDIYEDGLIPLFETVGKIYDLRLMMDPTNGKSRGYAFIIYFEKEHAAEAAKKFDSYEIAPGKMLKVNVSVANTRLFLGNIPKSKSKEEIEQELKKHAEGVTDVLIYSNPDSTDARKNRGFCFVDFSDHKAASDAKRRISQGKVRPWNNDLVVDWAEQQDEPDEETMSTVKVLYVKNVKEVVTEEALKEMFEKHGEVERAKKIRDYAFIHFKERDGALTAMEAMKGTMLEGVELDISLAKPQGDMKQKKKLAMKRGAMGYGMGAMHSPGMMRGRGYAHQEFYPTPPMGGRRGQSSSYQKFSQPQYGGFYGSDPYAAGYPAGYGGYADPYYSPNGYAPDPYYGGAAYAPSPARGSGGFSRAGAQVPRAGRGYGGGSPAGGRGGFRGGRAGGGRGGGKRPGGEFGGPNAKRGGRVDDFSSDVSMNTF